jgi:hypothetical protein
MKLIIVSVVVIVFCAITIFSVCSAGKVASDKDGEIQRILELREKDRAYIAILEQSNTELQVKVDKALAIATDSGELLKEQVASYPQLVRLVRDTQVMVKNLIEELQK